MNYRETGNKVPIPIDEITNFVQSQLNNFDTLINQSSTPRTVPQNNPYVGTLFYNTKNGKKVKVPDDLKKQIIAKWQQNKGKNININMSSSVKQEVDHFDDQEYQQPQNNKIIYVYHDSFDFVKLCILILTLFLILYFLNKMRPGTNHSVIPTNVAYYLSK